MACRHGSFYIAGVIIPALPVPASPGSPGPRPRQRSIRLRVALACFILASAGPAARSTPEPEAQDRAAGVSSETAPGQASDKDNRPEMATPRPRPPLRDPGSRVDRRGEAIFFSRDETPIRIACADCHLVTPPGAPPPDDLIRTGHTVYDAAGRGNWWNERITTDSGEAGEVCLKRFMGGTEMTGLMRTRLVEYMMSLAAPYASPFVIRRSPPGRVATSAGDPEKGGDIFRRACAGCHPGGGAGLGPDLTASAMTPGEIADLIRTGKDPMPFYQSDILTDEEVAHVTAFTYGLQPNPQE